jgi:16S rRNA (cytidine1402-2'-O)-methyltransferase
MAEHRGCLYVVATPIGHPDDITLRAVSVLGQVDLVAAEDTRLTARLLSRLGLSAKLISYHEHNEQTRTPRLLAQLESGQQIALVSDAGTPLVSDPGYRLIREAVTRGIRVVPVPGVSAAIAALSVSGLPTDSFVFAGFLPKKKHRRTKAIEDLAGVNRTVILYESPQRIAALVAELSTLCGEREAMLAREMTKRHEEFLHGTLASIGRQLAQRPAVKGECTLVVAGGADSQPVDDTAVADEIRRRLADGQGPGRIARALADSSGLSRNQVYAAVLDAKRQTAATDEDDAG